MNTSAKRSKEQPPWHRRHLRTDRSTNRRRNACCRVQRSEPRLPGAGLRRGRSQRRARLSESRTGEFRAAACCTLPGTAGRTAEARAPGSCPPAGGVKSYGCRCAAVFCAGSAESELDTWNLPDTDQTHPPESFIAVLLGAHPHESRTSTKEEEGRP